MERPRSMYSENLPTKNELLDEILNDIKLVDSSFYNKFISEHNLEENMFGRVYDNKDQEYLNTIFEDLGHYIVSHVNKKISSETIFTAVTNVYKNGYGFSDEEIRKIIPKVIEDNKKVQSQTFPLRYKIDSENNKEEYDNVENKFDMDKSALDEMLNDTNTNYSVDNNKTI